MSVDLSFIIPAYNVEAYIETTVNSILAQTHNNIELIIVDDGSEDETALVSQRIARTDKRVKVLRIQNGGPGHAKNTGLNEASGEYIHFMDSDDWISPIFADSYLRKTNIKAYVKYENDIDIILAPHYMVTNNDLDVTVIHLPEELKRRTREFSWRDEPRVFDLPTPAWDKIYRAEFLRSNKILFSDKTCEDMPFRWESLIKASHMAILSIPHYYYRIRMASVTGSKRVARDVFGAVELGKKLLVDEGVYDELKKYFAARTVLEVTYPVVRARRMFADDVREFEMFVERCRKCFSGLSVDDVPECSLPLDQREYFYDIVSELDFDYLYNKHVLSRKIERSGRWKVELDLSRLKSGLRLLLG